MDFEALREVLESRLRLMVNQEIDRLVLLGDSAQGEPVGILNDAGINTLAKGTEPSHETLRKAVTTLKENDVPSGNLRLVMHPADVEEIRVAKDANGNYLPGSIVKADDEAMPRLWGVPAFESNKITEGEALLGDFKNAARAYIRENATAEWFTPNDEFKRNEVTLRLESRYVHVVTRPASFVKVTGI